MLPRARAHLLPCWPCYLESAYCQIAGWGPQGPVESSKACRPLFCCSLRSVREAKQAQHPYSLADTMINAVQEDRQRL